MTKEINTILVPVDFSENTTVAISKALEYCPERPGVTIHLYHIQRIVMHSVASLYTRFISGYTRRQVNEDIAHSKLRLEAFAEEIRGQRKGIKVLCWVSFGEPVQQSIIKKSLQIGADLVIVGKHAHHPFFPFLNTVMPVRLAAVTGIPILTCRPGSLQQQVRTVVIPVGSRFPESKLAITRALRQRAKVQVRLVTFEGERAGESESKDVLVRTFRAFRSQFPDGIQYEVLERGNKALSLLHYCRNVGADVLIVEPGEETRVGNWSNSQIADHIPADSKVQVIAIC